MASGYILFFIGILVFFIKPKYVAIYYLLWATMMFLYVLNMIFPMTFEESTEVGHVYSTNYIWLCGILTIIKQIVKQDLKNIKILMVLGLLFAFVLVEGTIRGTLVSFQGWLRTYFCFVPLWIIVKENNISFKSYKKYIIIAFCIESFLVLFQTLTGYYPSYTNGEYAENGAVNIVGTFKRYNDFADNQSLLIMSLLFIYYNNPNFISKFFFFILLILGLFFVAIAGARTELIALTVSLSIIVYYGFPKWRKILSGGIVAILIVVFGYGLSFEKDTTSSASDSNYNRQRELLDFLEGDMDVSEESTFMLTVFLIGEYISYPDKLLTGPGLLYTTSNGYHGMVTKDYLTSDSFLALLLCETGIIGYLLLISFLVLIIKHSKEKIFPIAILVYMLIVSITDYGLFQGHSAIYWLFVIYYGAERKCNKSTSVPIKWSNKKLTCKKMAECR